MIRSMLCLVLLLLAGLLNSCSPPANTLKPFGDYATIEMRTNSVKGELLCTGDSVLLVRIPSLELHPIVAIPLRDLVAVHVQKFSNNFWIAPTVVTTVIAAAIFSGAFPSARIAFGAGVAAMFLLFGFSPSHAGVEEPITAASLTELQRYTRFPLGLSAEQMSALLKSYLQTEADRLK